ncbi:exo-alpha-sialidase, partial [Akkermansiaceae bacterium]|nr:exo-alpha-sialidase [Akkermansiaceae bacterium]
MIPTSQPIHFLALSLLCPLLLLLSGSESDAEEQAPPARNYSIPVLDLSNQQSFHTIVAKDIDKADQYLGHPSTVLLDDQKTILAAFPTGHGRGSLRLRRSPDGGKSWEAGPSLDISLAELPTLFKTKLPDGKTRIVLISCVPQTGELQWMDSDDQGLTWSPMEKQQLKGNRGIIVALSSMWQVRDESGKPTSIWRGTFHDYNFDNFTIDLTYNRVGNKWKTTFGNMRKIEF